MKIRLLAFATASDALGSEEREIEVDEGFTVGDLQGWLGERYPDLAPLWPKLAIAVDGEVCSRQRRLSEGCEVALLPPVSGGSGGSGDAMRAALVEAPIDAAALTASVSGARRGAVVLFLGTVRDHHQGRAVLGIEYSGYRPMALERLQRIIDELEGQDCELRLAITHRLGELAPGEASVAIAAASPHRAAAYAASRTALERLKAEVPVWKRERYADGERRWREEESLVDESLVTAPSPPG